MIDRMTRRSIFIGAAASIVSAPAIVRAASLVPVRGLLLPVERPLRLNPYGEHCRRLFYHSLARGLRVGRVSTTINGDISFASRCPPPGRLCAGPKDGCHRKPLKAISEGEVTRLMPLRRLPRPFGPPHAGYCERLFYHALASNLRTGQVKTVLNGKVVSAADARRLVAQARAYGWLPPDVSSEQND